MKFGRICLTLFLTLAVNAASCDKAAAARDSLATAQGVIVQAQQDHQAECTANPSKAVCTSINKMVRFQNVGIDALETYCGWPARPTAAQLATVSNVPCAKNANALGILTTAIQNLNVTVADFKGQFPPATPGTGGTN
jgi:hypothetical protein